MQDEKLFDVLNALVHGDWIGAEQKLSQWREEMVGTDDVEGERAALLRTGADMPVMAPVAGVVRAKPDPNQYEYATEPERNAWDTRPIMEERFRALEERLQAAERGALENKQLSSHADGVDASKNPSTVETELLGPSGEKLDTVADNPYVTPEPDKPADPPSRRHRN